MAWLCRNWGSCRAGDVGLGVIMDSPSAKQGNFVKDRIDGIRMRIALPNRAGNSLA